jgi:vacuolar-type H+-ATPase subunit E/Vma4
MTQSTKIADRLHDGLHDPHNHTSLAQLLGHIRHQRDQQCSTIHAEAERDSDRLVEDARARAALLLRKARHRERAAEADRLRAARTEQRGRVREVWLAKRSELAERGLAQLDEELQRLWRDDRNARRCWLVRTLADAARVLPGKRWMLQHPPGFDAEDLDPAIANACPGLTVEPVLREDLVAGFRVTSGNAAVDLSPSGLLARRDRIAGRLLARQSTAPPELES